MTISSKKILVERDDTRRYQRIVLTVNGHEQLLTPGEAEVLIADIERAIDGQVAA